MLLNMECKKCGTKFKLDIENYSKEEYTEKLKKMDFFSFCPGNHIELSSPINYLIIGDVESGSAPAIDDQIKELKKQYKEVFSDDEFRAQKRYTVQGFSMGCCICDDKQTKERAYFDFKRIGNDRYYYRI